MEKKSAGGISYGQAGLIAELADKLLDKEEPMDGDMTEHAAEIFLFYLNVNNGNLSKEEEKAESKRLGIYELFMGESDAQTD